MRDWYRHRDLANFENEKIISDEYSLEQTVKFMMLDSGL
jgi:hypothetical protein